MAGLIDLKDRYDIAFGNDTDFDRHGIVTPSVGLMNPNHYLAVAIDYLFRERDGWPADAAIGKTLVSSSMIDRLAAASGRRLCEVPVGFKWFVDGLLDGSFGFGGEESAGASFLRRDGTVWTTDKDGIILDLLAAEITREEVFNRLHQELPYQLTVETENWEEKPDGSVRIDQVVYVARDGHKGIILGKKGETIKTIGQLAREEISRFLERKVHLFLTVKVRPNWLDEAERYSEMGLDFRDGNS